MSAKRPRRRQTMAGVIGSLTCVAALTGSLLATSSFANPTGMQLSKTNNANHSGVFAATENVPTSATFPWTVTYRLTIHSGPAPGILGPRHKIVSITDSNTTNIGTCQALVGTTVNINQTKICSYSVTLTGPQKSPLVNTAKLIFDGGGGDVAISTSTVRFEPRCPRDTTLTKDGLCCPPGTDNPVYCMPLERRDGDRDRDRDRDKTGDTDENVASAAGAAKR